MKHSLITLAAALTLVSSPAAAFIQDMTDAERVARDYMTHYSAIDVDAMARFWSDDIEFHDPTAMGPGVEGEDGHHMQGRDEAYAMLSEFVETNSPIELGFQWHTVFESNGRVVFMGEVNALYPTQTEGQTFRWRSPQVTVITVRDGQIVRQVDYADYDGADRSIVLP